MGREGIRTGALSRLGACEQEPEVLVHEIFTARKHVADALIDQILETVRTKLDNRGNAVRDQGEDDRLFSEVTSALVEAATTGEFQLAIDLSKHCYALAQDYELSSGGQIHKGAITFNLALMYLAIDDFTAAMRYFEIAEAETRASQQQADPNKADSTFDLFRTFDLFDRNFWHDIDRKAAAHPLPVYRTLWGIDFGSGAAKDDSKKLSHNSKLLYLIALARRMRYHQLAKDGDWLVIRGQAGVARITMSNSVAQFDGGYRRRQFRHERREHFHVGAQLIFHEV